MSEHEELVERVAKALAKWSDYETPTPRHQRYAEVAVDALAPELEPPDPPVPPGLAGALAEQFVFLGYSDEWFHDRAVAILHRCPELRHEPPEGCEWVALPVEDVDRWCEGLGALVDVPSVRSGSIGVLGQVVDACHGAVARRPKPERKTVRVPAIEALGREVVSDEGSTRPTFTGYSIAGRLTGGLAIRSATGDCCQRIAPDGTVEVLAEDGAE